MRGLSQLNAIPHLESHEVALGPVVQYAGWMIAKDITIKW